MWKQARVCGKFLGTIYFDAGRAPPPLLAGSAGERGRARGRAAREEMAQPAFSAMDALEFPELHEESVGVLAFTRNLHKLMASAGVTDFTLKARARAAAAGTTANGRVAAAATSAAARRRAGPVHARLQAASAAAERGD